MPGGRVHAVARHRGADAVQSGHRRDGQGPPRSRDRRAGRAHGAGRGRDRDSVPDAQSKPWPGRLVAARAGGQEAVSRLDARHADKRARHRVRDWGGRCDCRGRRPGARRQAGRRPRHELQSAGRHDGHLPERPHPHRYRAAAGRTGRRAASPAAGRVAASRWASAGAGSRPARRRACTGIDRFRGLGGPRRVHRGARRRSTRAVLLPDGPRRPRAGPVLPALHDAGRARARPRKRRPLAALQRPDPGDRSRATAPRSRTRSSGSPTRSGTSCSSSPKAWTWTRST